MHLKIRKPELQALITQRMATDRFQDVEDFLLMDIQSSPEFETDDVLENATGELLIAMMQTSPHKEIEIEPTRFTYRSAMPWLFLRRSTSGPPSSSRSEVS